MKRRSFVISSILSGAAATVAPVVSKAVAANAPDNSPELYELRVYNLKNDTQQKLVEDHFSNAAIPALNRNKVRHVGVFTELKPAGQTKLYVLITYNGWQHFNMVNNALEHDTVYQQMAQAYLNAPAGAPAYERIESSVMKAFAKFPVLTPPAAQARVFELRQYQSATESAGKKKIEMFNDQGEIAIFKRLGFNPVFWGETIIGPLRPNLTYMVTFDDLEAKNMHWKAFVDDAQWKKISTVPAYADALLVNKITSTMLVPTPYSQI